ncbi:MAG: type VI secretion system-associated FHA domain protein [Pseudomonadota bacterium]
MLRLTILKGPEGDSEVATEHVMNGASLGAVRVGRADDCDWCLKDPTQRISRCHFLVTSEGGRFYIEDSSTNGTNRNGKLIGRGNRIEVKDGDELSLGDFVLGAAISSTSEVERDIGPAPSFLADSLDSSSEDSTQPDAFIADTEHSADAAQTDDAFSNIEAQSISEGILNDQRGGGYKRGITPQNDPLLDVGAQSDDALAGEPLIAPPSFTPHDPRPIFDDLQEPLSRSAVASNSGLSSGVPSAESSPRVSGDQIGDVEPVRSKPAQVIPEGFDPWGDSDPMLTGKESDSDSSLTSTSLGDALPNVASGSPGMGERPDFGVEPPSIGVSASIDKPMSAPAPQVEIEPADSRGPGREPATEATDTATNADATPTVEQQLRELLRPVVGENVNTLDQTTLLRTVGNLASIVAVMTPPLMAAIASRSQFKEQMRMRQTLIHARENNPLKVSTTSDLAMVRLLLNNEPGMLHGVEAVEQAFRELANHQTALLAALKPALQETVELLSPDRLDDDVPASALDKLTPAVRKGKLYDEFAKRYQNLTRDGGKNVEQRFLGELASEYDSAIFKLGH